MYISESSLFGFIVIVGIIILLALVIRLAYKSDMKHNKSKFETPKYASENKEPPYLKYSNKVYISFRDKVWKAYEGLKKSGYNVVWSSNMDGFLLLDDRSRSVGGSMCSVNINYDDRNFFNLNDPFYIVVSFGVNFDGDDYDAYKKQVEYLNNYLHKELKKTDIFYNVDFIKDSNMGVYYSTMIVCDNNKLCKDTEKLGEAELFIQLMSMVKQIYHDGEDAYMVEVLKNVANSSD
mgnify:FL=1|jgi:hypothetical protein